jgi:hypothetical protein
MKGRIFIGLFVCSLFFAVGGDAQNPDKADKPVWTLEFIRVRPENFGPAMGYLDDHWMRERAKAKSEGAVVNYHRIENAVLVTPGHNVGDPSSIVLLTEYKNMDAFLKSQKLYDSIRERERERRNFQIGGVIKPWAVEDLFETLNTQVFVEDPDTTSGFKLLTKQ